jgi:hypothetical protein
MKLKHKHKIFLAVALIIVVAITASSFYVVNKDDADGFPYNSPSHPSYDYYQGTTLNPGEYFEPIYNEITEDYRPKYDCFTEKQYEDYFGELPVFPKDFFTISKLIYEGKIIDYERISDAYWLQPEFYPTWFSYLPDSRYCDYERWNGTWTPEGYGCYPGIKEVSTSARGEKVVITTYIRTGFGVGSYQGLIVRPYLPTHAVSIRGTELFEQPLDAERYLKINIANPDDELYLSFKDQLFFDNVEDSDWFVILQPTFLEIIDKYGNKIGERGFTDSWVQIIHLEITLANDIPPGDYVVAIKFVTPCFEINQEYYYSQEHEYFGVLYYPAGMYFKTKRPHFQVILRVL